ncbi:sigma-70 family RNA polymerase sigma factor [Lysinibacillus sp. 54212]|uniref:sigma-70 family RNA polymerase sigma factor n=1 Tax=Lysinibacillus sp. 54212 TaxID=3119829 RepID=UPI002FCB554B
MEFQTFEEILHNNGDYILRLCYTYTKDWQIAEDLTQETFLRFYQAQNKFRHEANVKTYLYQVAVNRCKTYLMSWKYKGTKLVQLSQNLISKTHVEEEIIKKEIMAELYDQIVNLPVKYREVIVLYHYVEMTTAQIAKILLVSENTVKTRLRRGRQKLGDLLEKGEFVDGSDF